ncbi:PTGS2 [Mytilus coruscus]|uniref:prostaglandin-endoperoxide synthase n=1 Tax=Mytilus coruscus TaxID=42192 RepID=A0A6J8ASH1_MYTCO|nr:PTGS2 [Mytilus coruscus]
MIESKAKHNKQIIYVENSSLRMTRSDMIAECRRNQFNWQVCAPLVTMDAQVPQGNLCCSYPCQNNGVCLTRGFNEYECDCTGTDFYGKKCDTLRSHLIDIPPPYDNDHSYITLDAHFNQSFYTRVLPPVPEECPTPMGVAGKKELPDVNTLVKTLFVREKFKQDPIGTSVLFSFMAQHFSHMFLKTDLKRGPQYQWGGHGIDMTNIYGKNKHDENLLRSFKDGKLKLQTINGEDWPVLTKDANVEMHYLGPIPAERKFALGHSFFGQTIKIVIEEYVQHLSNYNFQLMFKPDLLFGENFQYQARASVEFNHLYFWHPLMPDEFIIGETNYTLSDILVNPGLVIKHGMATFVDSLSKQNAGAFTVKNHGAITLPVVQKLIQNGRTLRLQSYNNYRKRFNLQPFKSFEELTGNKKLAKVLENLYGDIDTVEFYVGLITEKRRPRGMFSEGLLEIGAPMSIKGVMSNPICSPKYWKPSTFGGDVGFEIVNTATLKKLFCQNMKGDCPEVSFKVPGFVEQKRTDDDCTEHEEL